MRTRWGLLPMLPVFLAVACGGDDGGDGTGGPDDNGTTLEGTRVLYDLADPCAEDRFPAPNRFFSEEALAACPAPSDPVEAAIQGAERGEGAPVDTSVELRVDRTVLPESLSSTVTFALDGTGSTEGLPPLVMLQEVVTGTVTSYTLVDFVASRSGLKVIRLEPRSDLPNGEAFFVVATRALVDESETNEPFVASDAVQVVVGLEEPEDVDIEEPVASRLLAERGRIAPLLPVLQVDGTPSIRPEDIVSIHSFRTRLGPERLVRLAERYGDAFAAGRMTADIAIVDDQVQLGELSPAIPPDDPQDFDDKVASIQRGTITMPRLLDETGRLRDTWDSDNQTIEVNFVLSVPDASEPYGLIAMFYGFGRGETDIISMAPENANATNAVMLVDLRCHGTRSPDPVGVCQEERTPEAIQGLVDTQPNNGDTRVAAGRRDGIPDDSGRFFLSGDPARLRDTQLAAALEILHVLSNLRFETQTLDEETGLEFDATSLGLIAHAQASPAALAAIAMFARFPEEDLEPRNRVPRVMFLGGGVGYADLILEGPSQLRTDFLDTAPEGITGDNARAYLEELEGRVLEALDPAVLGPLAQPLFERESESAVFYPRFPRDVPDSARDRLDETLEPTQFERASNVSCEHFLFFPCQGNEFQATTDARSSAAAFMSGASF